MNILEKIIANRRKLLQKEKDIETAVSIKERALRRFADMGAPPQFLGLHEPGIPFLIAEIKKGSPSKGVMRKEFDHMKIAGIYLNNRHVRAVSVLTEPDFFYGSYDIFREVHNRSFESRTYRPLLMKDFTLDEYQINRAYLLGASGVLLIGAVLSEFELVKLKREAEALGLSVLYESHTETEFKKGIDCGMQLIGINNRDLATFKTDISTTLNIVERCGLPDGCFIVSESGISCRESLEKLFSAGVSGFLVGGYFMERADINAAINGLLGE